MITLKPEDVDTASTPVVPADEAVEQSPDTVTEVAETEAPVAEEPQAEQTVEPDYKAELADSERRRKGLDRKLSRLQRGKKDTRGEDYLTGDADADSKAYQHPLTQRALTELADLQLKEGVREVLKDFKHIPANVRKAITKNPRGFVPVNVNSVDDAVEEIESFLSDSYGVSAEGVEKPPKEFPATQTNATIADSEREKSPSEMNVEELNLALDRKEITLEDLEVEIKKRGSRKEVKKLK